MLEKELYKTKSSIDIKINIIKVILSMLEIQI